MTQRRKGCTSIPATEVELLIVVSIVIMEDMHYVWLETMSEKREKFSHGNLVHNLCITSILYQPWSPWREGFPMLHLQIQAPEYECVLWMSVTMVNYHCAYACDQWEGDDQRQVLIGQKESNYK